jgi:3-phosphoshikimate 1-carboxyvinyltransferase
MDASTRKSPHAGTPHGPAGARPAISRRAEALSGTGRVPGDKSISHRSLMLGGIARGTTTVHGLLEGEDVLATAAAMRALGAKVARGEDGVWQVEGVGVGGLGEPADILDMGNSGTSTRLLSGLLATHPINCFLTGDASLRKRPMARVTGPLSEMGAGFVTRAGGRLPLAIVGTGMPRPIRYTLPVASAQVKSAILLAGLNTPGRTTVVEPVATRDHSEHMLRHFGAILAIEDLPEGGQAISIEGRATLAGRTVTVPADVSSAAFPMIAAAILPGSEIVLPGVGLNPRRAGIITTLGEMGADIAFENRRQEAGEPAADLRIRAGRLRGVTVPADRAPSMIDEYPVLAVAAACAEGTTRMIGLSELRVKESDRLAMMAEGLSACGVAVEIEGDDLIVHGGRAIAGGATIATALDHRIAMSFLVLGLVARDPVTIDDLSPIDTSFPGFLDLMNGLGARMSLAG